MDACFLKARLDIRGVSVTEHFPERPIHSDADERDDIRPKFRDLLLEDPPPLDVFRQLQHVDSRTWPGDEVRHPEAPLRQPDVIFMRHWFGDDARFVEEAPEPVRRTGEMVARERRRHAWVDADEQHPDARFNFVGEPKFRPVELWTPGLRP